MVILTITSTWHKEKLVILQSIGIIYKKWGTRVCLLFQKIWTHHNSFLQIFISGKSISQYTLHSLIFNPLHSVINGEQHEEHASLISIQPLRKVQNIQSSIHAAQLPIKNSGCVAWSRCITTLHLIQTLWTSKK